MKQYRQGVKKLCLAILIASLLALAACSMFKPPPVVVMPEARALLLIQGEQTPFRGWLISESAMAKLLEAAEMCRGK